MVPGPACESGEVGGSASAGVPEGGSTMTLKQERRAVIRATSWIRRNAERPAVVNMSLAFAQRPCRPMSGGWLAVAFQ